MPALRFRDFSQLEIKDRNFEWISCYGVSRWMSGHSVLSRLLPSLESFLNLIQFPGAIHFDGSHRRSPPKRSLCGRDL